MADTTFIPNADGMFGGNGLIGGLILGSLLRNNGNLFGGGDGAAAGVATAATVNNTVATSAIQSDLGDIKAAIPLAEAQLQAALGATQNAIQSSVYNSQTVTQAGFSALAQNLNQVENNVQRGLIDIDNHVNEVQTAVQLSTLQLNQAVTADGDKTRALIQSINDAALNRQLGDANARIIALETRADTSAAARGVEVNTTNNINQMQMQQQQQQQYAQLANLIWGLGQQIRSTNEAINVGSGTQTANPVNTNTNIR